MTVSLLANIRLAGLVSATADPRHPHCGVVTLSGDALALASFNITAGFAMTRFPGIVPPSWNTYVAKAFRTWMGRQHTSYDAFRQTLLAKLCTKDASADSLELAPDCYLETTLAVEPTPKLRILRESSAPLFLFVGLLFLVLICAKAIETYGVAHKHAE
jgi:hypothetical protein